MWKHKIEYTCNGKEKSLLELFCVTQLLLKSDAFLVSNTRKGSEYGINKALDGGRMLGRGVRIKLCGDFTVNA